MTINCSQTCTDITLLSLVFWNVNYEINSGMYLILLLIYLIWSHRSVSTHTPILYKHLADLVPSHYSSLVLSYKFWIFFLTIFLFFFLLYNIFTLTLLLAGFSFVVFIFFTDCIKYIDYLWRTSPYDFGCSYSMLILSLWLLPENLKIVFI